MKKWGIEAVICLMCSPSSRRSQKPHGPPRRCRPPHGTPAECCPASSLLANSWPCAAAAARSALHPTAGTLRGRQEKESRRSCWIEMCEAKKVWIKIVSRARRGPLKRSGEEARGVYTNRALKERWGRLKRVQIPEKNKKGQVSTKQRPVPTFLDKNKSSFDVDIHL